MPSKTKRELLSGTNGLKSSKFIGCNTLQLEYENGVSAIRYHNTDVITTYPNGNIEYTTGGWRTYTTKERLNRKARVWSEKGIWYIIEPATGNKLEFYDGITFDKEGKLVGEVKELDHKRIKAVKKKIAVFIKAIDELETIPFPDSGDCWDCSMQTNEGKTLGDVTKNHSHLESHLDELYIHGSLIYNALKERGYPNPALIMQMNCKTSIKHAVRRYIKKRLLPELSV